MSVQKFRSYITIAMVLCCSAKVFGSPQMPDYIIYKNDTIATYNLLVEQYLQKHRGDSGQLFGLSFRDSLSGSFNCWRGYQAIYKIEHDSLFVADIIDCGTLRNRGINITESLKRMAAFFGDRLKDGKVFIDWFTGNLNFRANKEAKVLRWDGVFYTSYEKEKVLYLLNGKLINAEEVDNYIDDPKAINRRYKDTISKILYENIRKATFKHTDDCDCSEKYLITINKTGRVSQVATVKHKSAEEIDDEDDKKEFISCTNTILKALGKLKFDIIKDKGIPISEEIYLELWINDDGTIENWTH